MPSGRESVARSVSKRPNLAWSRIIAPGNLNEAARCLRTPAKAPEYTRRGAAAQPFAPLREGPILSDSFPLGQPMAASHILVVDDEPDIRSLVQDILADEGYQVETAGGAVAARAALRTRRPDLVLLDVWMPDTDGISLLREWSQDGRPPMPVVMISGHGTIETAVEATRLGAYDFIEKPISLAKLLLTVERALEASRLQQENEGLKRRLPEIQEPIGSSRSMADLRAQIERAAQTEACVLFEGEPGTGKQVLARFLHERSGRRDRPFVVVSGGALMKPDAARDLFGVEEGGELRYGLIEQAQGGTLFLDEIAALGSELQTRLAAALAARQFTRVGGQDLVPLQARIVSGSSKDLAREVSEGRFQEALLYQLRVLPMRVTPLRERPEDIPDLLRHFAETFADRDQLPYR
ncbi:MAG TPA: sigma-54 dependent transcriptional regulator, partial [Xanthomonadales bacterium]|nr:sigma-54 dependent transcriptional regulator [Xanthomonadales bacterium]